MQPGISRGTVEGGSWTLLLLTEGVLHKTLLLLAIISSGDMIVSGL